jgi:transcriptional regulator with XRE-family HTH domain
MPKLGNIIKEARLAKEMTLEDLSSKCGYSKALISRIENNSVSPSITSLAEISAALGLKLHDVFASLDDEEPIVVRKDARRNFSQMDGKQVVEFLSNGAFSKKMQPVLISSEDGALLPRERATHSGEEFLHVLQGKAEVVVGERRFILGPGDSIHFKASIPHGYGGIGKGKTVSLTVAYPPYY